MKVVVLDASITIGSCVGEPETRGVADAVLSLLQEGTAVVPGIWLGEVANALVSKERTGRQAHRLAAAEVSSYLAFLEKLPVVVDWGTPQSTFGAVAAVARSSGLTVYDAHYLELAQRLGVPLCSLDAELCEAAKAAGVVVFSGTSVSDWKHQ